MRARATTPRSYRVSRLATILPRSRLSQERVTRVAQVLAASPRRRQRTRQVLPARRRAPLHRLEQPHRRERRVVAAPHLRQLAKGEPRRAGVTAAPVAPVAAPVGRALGERPRPPVRSIPIPVSQRQRVPPPPRP